MITVLLSLVLGWVRMLQRLSWRRDPPADVPRSSSAAEKSVAMMGFYDSITPELQRWMNGEDPDRATEIDDRLAEIERLPITTENCAGDYTAPAGHTVGTEQTPVRLPLPVTQETTHEWVTLRLEKAGIAKSGATKLTAMSGFSMRYLNHLARRVEQRDATLGPHELAVLRSRGLV